MNFLEKTFMVITFLAFLFSVQMVFDIPQKDIPDIKDVAFLFPNIN